MEPNERSESTIPLLAPVSEPNLLRAALRSRAGIRQALLLIEALGPPVAVQSRHGRIRTKERSDCLK
jgi:hypothetical protein